MLIIIVITIILMTDHPRSGMLYRPNFDFRGRLSVCMSVRR